MKLRVVLASRKEVTQRMRRTRKKPVEILEEEDGDARQVETVETLEDRNVIYWRPKHLRKDSIWRHSLSLQHMEAVERELCRYYLSLL